MVDTCLDAEPEPCGEKADSDGLSGYVISLEGDNLVTKRATDVIARIASKSIGEEKPYKKDAVLCTLGIPQDSSTIAKNWSNRGMPSRSHYDVQVSYSICQ